MMASLAYALCLLYSPPTPPVYQGYVVSHASKTAGYVHFVRTNSREVVRGGEAWVLIGVSDKDRQTFMDNPGKLLQVVARETSCHGWKILRVSYWKFSPAREPKK